MKTAELIGDALDCAVALCEGLNPQWKRTWLGQKNPWWFDNQHMVDEYVHVEADGTISKSIPKFSSGWAWAGPIIEREGISVRRESKGGWYAFLNYRNPDAKDLFPFTHCLGFDAGGDTAIEAAMRCYVTSKLGDVVEIPSKL